MNLIIDRGNTRTKFFQFQNDELIHKKALINTDEKAIEKILEEINYDKMIVSSTSNLPSFFKKHKFICLDHSTATPITLNYKTPTTLGSDRIALAVGAHTLFPNKNCLIIGTGTCITTDFIDHKACYQGGSIAPGLTLRLQSLHNYTDKLPLVKYNMTKTKFHLTGKSTEQSIESGVFNGVFFEIDGIISYYQEIYKDLTVVLTGGDQEIFVKNLKSIIFAHSNIQAIGLNRILNYNA